MDVFGIQGYVNIYNVCILERYYAVVNKMKTKSECKA